MIDSNPSKLHKQLEAGIIRGISPRLMEVSSHDHATNIFYLYIIDYYYYETICLAGYPMLFIDYAGFRLPTIDGGSC